MLTPATVSESSIYSFALAMLVSVGHLSEVYLSEFEG